MSCMGKIFSSCLTSLFVEDDISSDDPLCYIMPNIKTLIFGAIITHVAVIWLADAMISSFDACTVPLLL